MTLLVDYQIAHYCLTQNMVVPFSSEYLNPVSLDVHVGYSMMIEDKPRPLSDRIEKYGRTLQAYKPNLIEVNLHGFSEESPYLLQPNEFVLVGTLEVFNMPSTVAGEFRLRSSYARMGYDQSLAVWLEPGWNNSVLTMEIKNNWREHQLPIYPGMRIGQVIFRTVEQSCIKYQLVGHYNGDLKVSASKI